MSQSLNILDPQYREWIVALGQRYRQSQIRATVSVNREMLLFYWHLGKEITQLQLEARWGSKVLQTLSRDLRHELPGAKGLSPTNLLYAKNFYLLYSQLLPQGSEITQQLVEQLPQSTREIAQQVAEQFPKTPEQSVEQYNKNITIRIAYDMFLLPWGHHMIVIDKFRDEPLKALFYLHTAVAERWSRSMLLNGISACLYERQGKADTNFTHTLPSPDSDLAQELTRDPYLFGFTGLTQPYNERLLKERLLENITQFLVELGTGFSYVGKEYRIEVGQTENFIDLLFYNLNLSCYVVVEVKIGKFEFADIGQIGGYIVACNHQLRKPGRDNPTIGLLICKEKDRIQAQYALESSSQPIGISEYELEKFYPEKVEGTIPTIEEIEKLLTKYLP